MPGHDEQDGAAALTVAELSAAELAALAGRCHDWAAVASLDGALALIGRIGAFSTWSAIGTLPSLSASLADGADQQVVWQAQEEAPRRRVGFYGKVFGGKGTILALPLFAELAAVAGGLDHEARYAAGRLSADAKTVADHIAGSGPSAGDKLRRDCGYAGKDRGKAFNAALAELQQQLLITPVDQIPGNGRFKTPVWQLSRDWWDGSAPAAGGPGAALHGAIRGLTAAAGVVSDADLVSWLKPYGRDPRPALADLTASGELTRAWRAGRASVYIHRDKRHLIDN